jgi:hypothetical protein
LILAVRLQEILGNDEISIDDFVEAITKPNNTDSLVISMIDGSGKIDFSRVSRAANAVSEASGGVTAFSQEEVATKATLVIGSQWKWIERRAQEVSEIISDRAMLGTIQGALWTNYSLEEADANKFLLSIRKELGRSAVLKDGRLSLSNPYIHAVIANIAGISGVQTQALLKEFYSDLVEGSGVGIIDAAVMNALVEIGMTGRKGISFFEPFVSERFASTVQGMGMIVSGPDAAFLKAPSGSRKEVAHSL